MKKAFLRGAILYPLLEIAYRGRTHPTMALAGGFGGALLEHICRRRGPIWKKALLGAAGITMIEYGMGLLFNRRHQIWDYRGMRGNLSGQICPHFSFIWMAMAAGYAFLSQKNML